MFPWLPTINIIHEKIFNVMILLEKLLLVLLILLLAAQLVSVNMLPGIDDFINCYSFRAVVMNTVKAQMEKCTSK